MSAAGNMREIARQAYRFGYAMVENYRTLYAQAIDAADPRYTGGFGVYRHYSQPSRPENTDIVTPNNDTPYSWLWLDLRAEPWLVTVPAIDRYYILPFHDLYTIYAGYVGAVSTGAGAGTYLIAGPSWDGAVPDGVDGVIRSATDFVGSLTRTALMPDGVDAMRAIQDSYLVRPLSADTGRPAPPAPPVSWPVWQEHEHTATPAFYELLDFLLGFAPPLAEDAEIRATLAAAGIDGSGTFTVAGLSPADREALAGGLADARAELTAAAGRIGGSVGLFGTHAQMAGRYDERNAGAMKGLYGLPTTEAWYGGWLRDSTGAPPDGSRAAYTVTFTPATLPAARYFWSATMYRLPERLLVANELDRYSIGDRTPGLVREADGSLTLQVAHRAPEAKANWLPAPDGPFSVVLRAYGPDAELTAGRYELPPLSPISPGDVR